MEPVKSSSVKEIPGLIKFLCEDHPKEVGQMGFNGAFVAMPLTCFETGNKLLDNLEFETSIVKDKGSGSLKYLTPGSAFPQIPVRLTVDDRDEIHNLPAKRLLENVIILKGGKNLDIQFDTPNGLQDEDICQLFDNFKQFESSQENDMKSCLKDLEMTDDVGPFVNNIFKNYFPSIEDPDNYLLYFTGDLPTMVSIAISGALPPGEEINSFNKSTTTGKLLSDDNVYVGDITFRVEIDNSRLLKNIAMFRPVFHGSNKVYLNRENKNYMFGSAYVGPLKKNPVLSDFNRNFEKLAIDLDKSEMIPRNGFFWSMCASLVMTVVPTPFPIESSNKTNRPIVNRLRVIKEAGCEMSKPRGDLLISSKDVFTTAMLTHIHNTVLSPPSIYTYREDGIGREVIRNQSTTSTSTPFLLTSRSCLLYNLGDSSTQDAVREHYYSDSAVKLSEMMDFKSSIVHVRDCSSVNQLRGDLGVPEKQEGFKLYLRKGLEDSSISPPMDLLTMFNCDLGVFKTNFVRKALFFVRKEENIDQEFNHPAFKQPLCCWCGGPFKNAEARCFCYLSLVVCKALTKSTDKTVIASWNRFFANIPKSPNTAADLNMLDSSFTIGLRVNESRSTSFNYGDSRVCHSNKTTGLMNKKDRDRTQSDDVYLEDLKKTKKVDDLMKAVLDKLETFLSPDHTSEFCDIEWLKEVDFAFGRNFFKSGVSKFSAKKALLLELQKDPDVPCDYQVNPLFKTGQRFLVHRTTEEDEGEDDDSDKETPFQNLFNAGKRKQGEAKEVENKKTKNEVSVCKKVARAIIHHFTTSDVTEGELNLEYLNCINDKPREILKEIAILGLKFKKTGYQLQRGAIKVYMETLSKKFKQVLQELVPLMGFESEEDLLSDSEKHFKLKSKNVERKICAFFDPESSSSRFQKLRDRLLVWMATLQAWEVAEAKHGNKAELNTVSLDYYINCKSFAMFGESTTMKASYYMPNVDDCLTYSISPVGTPGKDGGMNVPEKISIPVTLPLSCKIKMDAFRKEHYDIEKERFTTEKKLNNLITKHINKIRGQKKPQEECYVNYDLLVSSDKSVPLVPAMLYESYRRSGFDFSKCDSHDLRTAEEKDCLDQIMNYLEQCPTKSPVAINCILKDIYNLVGFISSACCKSLDFLILKSGIEVLPKHNHDPNVVIRLLLSKEDHLLPFIHAFCCMCEVYGMKSVGGGLGFNNDLERDYSLASIAVPACLKLFWAEDNSDQVDHIRKAENRFRSLNTMKTMIFGEERFQTFCDVKCCGPSENLLSMKLLSYQGMDSTMYTKFKVAAGFPRNSLVERITKNRRDAVCIKMPYLRLKNTERVGIQYEICEVAREGNIYTLINLIVNRNICAKELALHFAKELDLDITKSPIVEDQESFFKDLCDEFFPEYVEDYRIEELKAKLGPYLLPHLISDYVSPNGSEEEDWLDCLL